MLLLCLGYCHSSYSFCNFTPSYSWTSFLILDFHAVGLRTFSYGPDASPVHSFATDEHEEFFMVVLPSNDRISMILFYQMKQQASSVERIKKRWLWREVLLCIYVIARAQPRPVMLWKN